MVSPSGILGVVKSDAYGHGAVCIAAELERAGARFLGTATAGEAVELRLAGCRSELIVLSGLIPPQIPLIFDFDLTPCVYTMEFLRALTESVSARNRKVKVHVKVDTGMGRLGFSPEDAAHVLRNPHPLIHVEGVFTHLACADLENDAYTRDQLRKFQDFLEMNQVSVRYLHTANSAAMIHYPESHLDLVRPGLLMYGITPIRGKEVDVMPVAVLKSRIVALRRIRKGDTIGYGRTFQASRDSVIATLPIGYSDGLRRALSNRLSVSLHGTRCRIAGTISMDLCMIDVTDVSSNVHLYDEVTLLGPEVSAWEWADLLNTIPYEITCLIGARVPRVYFRNGEICDVYYP